MKNTALILGFFDGVHAGHREVIKTAVEYAQQHDCKSVLLTFQASPAEYFNGKAEYIFSREKSNAIIKSLGVDEVIVNSFPELANIEAEEYLHRLIKEFNAISISSGFNYSFGAKRVGTPDFLEQQSKIFGYKYFCTPACESEYGTISSTLIKKMLTQGRIEIANTLLKSNFSVQGEVIEGAKIGRTLGFPTANLIYPSQIARIPYGVYQAKTMGKPAILNWGIRPTVNNKKEELLEIHIPEFSGDLYGQILEVEILKKIRDEKKFNTLEELKTQIKKDIEECLKL